MYKDYFQFKELPFTISPDPRYLFMSQQHSEALQHLQYSISEYGGFTLLTGESGTGKTTLCRLVIANITDAVDIVLILNPKLNVRELLASICDELRIHYFPSENGTKELVDALNDHLMATHANGKRTILIIDEAQNLSFEVLEQIRLLTNLETTREKLLQIILVGQPELFKKLQNNNLRQLMQRITCRYHLEPLSYKGTVKYINHRVAIATGRKVELFSNFAVYKIYRVTRGIPRLINLVCDRALLNVYANDRAIVKYSDVRQAIREVPAMVSPPWYRNLRYQSYAVASFFITALASLYIYYNIDLPFVSATDQRMPITTEHAAFSPTRTKSPSTIKTYREINAALKKKKSVSDTEVAMTKVGNQGNGLKNDAREIRPEGPSGDSLVSLLDDGVETVAKAENKVDDFARDPTLSIDNGFIELFGRWGLQLTNAGDYCLQASEKGLRCLFQTATWEFFSQLNRPAILELLLPDGQDRYVTIVSLRDKKAVIRVKGSEIELSEEAILKYWQGRFIMFWKPPVPNLVVQHPGSQSNLVKWSREKLAPYDKSQLSEQQARFFDNELKQTVVAFQNTNGIKPDGIIGPHTIIHLNSYNNDLNKIPMLVSAIQ